MNTSVVLPAKAAPALGFLKSRRNDLEIFVEDSTTPNMWVKLLQAYLPEGVKLESVNVLGSRREVIAACKEDQAADGRKKLYFIDGDLDLLCGLRRPGLKHLYRLRAYCVENYLLDEDAFVVAVTTLAPRTKSEVVLRTMDFEGWFLRNEEALCRLFVCYAVIAELDGGRETVGFSVHKLFREGDTEYGLCPRKVLKRIQGLYRSVLQRAPRTEVRRAFDRVTRNRQRLGVKRCVSGKDYLFPPLYALVKRKFGVNVKVGTFATLVAQCTEAGRDPYLSRRLREVTGG